MRLHFLITLSVLLCEVFVQSKDAHMPSLRKSSTGTMEAPDTASYLDWNDSNPAAHRRLETWNQIGSDIEGEFIFDFSGGAVAISQDGTIVAVGAELGNGNYSLFNSTFNSTISFFNSTFSFFNKTGSVRVFEFQDGDWTQLGSDLDGEGAFDGSGWTVSLSDNGKIVAVGAPFNIGDYPECGCTWFSPGHVRVYRFVRGDWYQIGDDINGETAFEMSGWSVDLSGDGGTVAIGAITSNETAPLAGSVQVYKVNKNDVWKQMGSDIDGEFLDESGWSVALSDNGKILAVGAPSFILNQTAGSVKIYKWNGRDWKQRGSTIFGEGEGDDFGFAVDMSCKGDIVAIGAGHNDGVGGNNTGHTQVYEFKNGDWRQMGNDIDGVADTDFAGDSLSLSDSGTMVAVSSPGNDAVAENAGHVRVFKYDGIDWNQVGDDVEGESEFDLFGFQVALSGDGSTLASGAPAHDFARGHVQVYQLDTPTGLTSGCSGDPHFRTWAGEHFQYHGQCDMVLTKDVNFADGLGIEVHIRTKLVRFWSYIKVAAVRIGEDVLEVKGSGDDYVTDENNYYWINSEYQGELTTLGGFSVTYENKAQDKEKRWMHAKLPGNRKARKFEIDLGSKYPGEIIVISAYKEFVRVDFKNASNKSFGKSVGMLGEFESGKTLARDGVTVLDDFSVLGNEWQVLPADGMLFHAASDPQFPEKCIEPKTSGRWNRRRLGESSITETQAEAACASIEDPMDRKDCVYDVLATQDTSMVGAY